MPPGYIHVQAHQFCSHVPSRYAETGIIFVHLSNPMVNIFARMRTMLFLSTVRHNTVRQLSFLSQYFTIAVFIARNAWHQFYVCWYTQRILWLHARIHIQIYIYKSLLHNFGCRLVWRSDFESKGHRLSSSHVTRIRTWTSQEPTLQQTECAITTHLAIGDQA